MTTTPTDQQQPDLERLINRVALRAAENVAGTAADLGTRLALAQESLEQASAALRQKDEQLAEKDAELARATQTADQLRQRVAELEALTGGGDVVDGADEDQAD